LNRIFAPKNIREDHGQRGATPKRGIVEYEFNNFPEALASAG
jgi:hypothetical protein